MATSKSGISSLEFHTQHASGCRDCVQPATGESKPSPSQLRCCMVQQTSYLTRESRREFLSSKDAAKRKRVNRIAKLKQCKLDARREQWLSQGNRCRPEEHKQVAQPSTRNQEKYVRAENTKAVKDAEAEESECHLHDVSSEFVTEDDIITNQNDVSFFPAPSVVGSGEDHSKIIHPSEVEECGKSELLPWALQDIDSCKTKGRPGDPDSSARDSEEAREEGTTHRCFSGASENILCSSCMVPDLVCFGSDISEGCSESSEVGLNHIPGGSKLLVEEEVVLSPKNERYVCRPGFRIDQISCSSACPVTSSIVETGPDVNDLSFTHEAEDDWELAADALYVPGSSLTKTTSELPKSSPEVQELLEQKGRFSGISKIQNGILKPEYKCKADGLGIKNRGVGGRAWRPDDMSRPQTLPPLSKQVSFPQESSPSVWSGTQQSRSLWGPPPVPSYCPICTEELDPTDSSFFPCSCGFRLCLFCHHRISSDDGRCPGCRKMYSPDAAMKLSRTTFCLSV